MGCSPTSAWPLAATISKPRNKAKELGLQDHNERKLAGELNTSFARSSASQAQHMCCEIRLLVDSCINPILACHTCWFLRHATSASRATGSSGVMPAQMFCLRQHRADLHAGAIPAARCVPSALAYSCCVGSKLRSASRPTLASLQTCHTQLLRVRRGATVDGVHASGAQPGSGSDEPTSLELGARPPSRRVALLTVALAGACAGAAWHGSVAGPQPPTSWRGQQGQGQGRGLDLGPAVGGDLGCEGPGERSLWGEPGHKGGRIRGAAQALPLAPLGSVTRVGGDKLTGLSAQHVAVRDSSVTLGG
jgi:hypothetical protein